MKLNKFDIQWSVALFGTAVGAGILFLPIRAGMNGVIPILIMILLIFPMVYLSHKYLANFVIEAKNSTDITQSAKEGFGSFGGNVLSVLYFFAIYPICLAYGVGITNTMDSFLHNQLSFTLIPRWILAIILITLMMLVMTFKKNWMLKITNIITYPLIILLFMCSIYLIPQWQIANNFIIPNISELLSSILFSLPILVFAFNHSPAISYFAKENKEKYGSNANIKIKNTLFFTTCLLSIFIMFFVISCVLSLSQDDFINAKNQNIPILSYFANINKDNIILKYVAPEIAFFAIISSFFGHYLGAYDGLTSILKLKIPHKILSPLSSGFIYISMVIVAIYNPSILGFIEDLGSPILVIILFLMPIYAIYKVPFMHKYKNQFIINIFLFIMGFITLLSVLFKLLK